MPVEALLVILLIILGGILLTKWSEYIDNRRMAIAQANRQRMESGAMTLFARW